uniref:Uncharacterized protein n=1 Tax=Hyaloperonospora arabidopsidis (strain Emoy2) TaxID=559515 RepID=M4BU48_HYAAE
MSRGAQRTLTILSKRYIEANSLHSLSLAARPSKTALSLVPAPSSLQRLCHSLRSDCWSTENILSTTVVYVLSLPYHHTWFFDVQWLNKATVKSSVSIPAFWSYTALSQRKTYDSRSLLVLRN